MIFQFFGGQMKHPTLRGTGWLLRANNKCRPASRIPCLVFIPMFDAWITALISVGVTLLASLCIHYLRQVMKDKTLIDKKNAIYQQIYENF